ncbi:MAG TPA: hypothetical protein VIK72_04855 [Clostridiaceae bacterium]
MKFSGKLKEYLIIAYCFILIASTFILYIIPKDNFVMSKNTINVPSSLNYVELAIQGKLNEANGYIETKAWSFVFTGERLIITDKANNILIGERKSIDDGKIEVINYSINSSYHGINFTDIIKPSNVTLSNNNLFLNDVSNPPTPIKINQFSLDFTLNQFAKVNPTSDLTDTSPFFSMKIIYIKIPKSLQIDDTSSFKSLQMIN